MILCKILLILFAWDILVLAVFGQIVSLAYLSPMDFAVMWFGLLALSVASVDFPQNHYQLPKSAYLHFSFDKFLAHFLSILCAYCDFLGFPRFALFGSLARLGLALAVFLDCPVYLAYLHSYPTSKSTRQTPYQTHIARL